MSRKDYSHKDIFTSEKSFSSGKKFWFLFLGLCLFLVIISGIFYFLLYSDYFKVRSIEISGGKLVSESFLKTKILNELSGLGFWRGFFGPDNIFFFLGLQGELKTIELPPALKKIEANVNFLQRKVVLKIEEREIFGVFCQFASSSENIDGESCYGFDSEGLIFTRVPKTEGSLILKITDESEQPVFPGMVILRNASLSVNIFKTVEIIKKSGLNPISINIKNSKLREWEAVLGSGPALYFDLDSVPNDLLGVLNNFKIRSDFNKLEYLDFRVPNRVYYK